MNLMIQSISRFSNNTHPCPFLPPEQFEVKDFVLSNDLMPPIMPTGEYRLDIEYLKDQNMTVRYCLIQVFVQFRGLTLVDLRMGK